MNNLVPAGMSVSVSPLMNFPLRPSFSHKPLTRLKSDAIAINSSVKGRRCRADVALNTPLNIQK